MLTALVAVLALAGTEPHYKFEDRRDPFITIFVGKKIPIEREGYLRRRMSAAGLTEKDVTTFFSDSRLGIYSRLTMKNGAKKKDWDALRDEMIAPASIAAGLNYYRRHEKALRLGRERYGVLETSAVAIARIESCFGTYLSNPKNPHDLVVDIFYTKVARLSARPVSNKNRTPRWQAAANALVELIAHCKNNSLDCFAIKGSWAGALGITQIMLFNLDEYGVDGDSDGRVDLVGSGDDALLSTMKFLARNHYARTREGRLRGFARYYGEAGRYPAISLEYETLLEKAINAPRGSE